MDTHTIYWQNRLHRCKTALEKNGFQVFLAENCAEAREITRQQILPDITFHTISYGDSMTLRATGILEDMKKDRSKEFLETFPKDIPRKDVIERRRQALLADLFFTGSNAVTETGKLLNLDMIGNRVAGIIFGPKHVILTIGRNKLVPDTKEGMARIKSYAAPLNAIRHDTMKTPCQKTGSCMDCKSPDRICNNWVITEKCFPQGRIRIILINEDLGL